MKPRAGFRDIVWLALRLTNIGLLVCIAGLAGLVLGTYSGIAEIIPNARDLGDFRPGQASRVLSAEGELLGQVSTQQRQFVPLEEVPKWLPQGFVAVEDHGFYQHMGVDPRGLIRGVIYGRGTSTITQQLARNIYLTQKRSLTRKLAEIVLAMQLERAYTKPEIMELYLNQIYFGEGAYGVQLAAKTYFGKSVSSLTLPECALLAGLPKRPEHYSPFKDEQRAIDRRNMVLSAMADEGYITSEEAVRAKAASLQLVKEHKPLGLATYRAPYFTNYVLREVARKYGPDALYKGGMTVYTTLNLEMQEAAEEAVTWGIQYAHGRRWNVEQIALVALNAQTGAIKAMVGGVDYKKNQYNVVIQGRRQAGSAFKPFVYTAALEAGYTPDSIVNDSPVTYRGAGGKPWSPRNYYGGYSGRVTFRVALYKSINIPAVKVAAKIGITSVIDTAERMGISSPSMEPYLPLAIGACSVSPLEMASAFSVFATRGMRTEPYGIAKIVDATGRTVYEHNGVTWRALDERVADQMVDMLSDVIKRGTAAGIRRQLTFPAAGKTGTTNEHKDAWFVGFTEELSAAVWAGNLQPSSMGKVAGASLPAPVWARFMVKAQPIIAAAQEQEEQRAQVIKVRASDQGAEEQPRPPAEPANTDAASNTDTATKKICPTTGLLAGPNCPNPVEVTYDVESGAEPPTEVCDVHGSPGAEEGQPPAEEPRPARDERVTLPICAITNKIATARCPLVVNRTFQADEAPTETCDRHMRREPGL